jgi:hypothetical protein
MKRGVSSFIYQHSHFSLSLCLSVANKVYHDHNK